MLGYYLHLEEETLKNDFFRKVLFTGPNSQLVLMALQPFEDIGSEIHKENDQFFRFEAGEGRVIIGDQEFLVGDGDSVVIPAGTKHNIINTSKTVMLKMYTIYSPSHHPNGTIHETKAEAIVAEAVK
ncbi:cupin domain-containing protein [Patescibacteria group bacterium]|nr:cupin domain-containing protein [Patescibacteria group bacterium]MBU1967158.1 cupin domain-containing protein [Patescibacteria group bacterium]MBU2543047.1 cupin domain-containing protein [Patescibacteria group bacterium]